MLNRHAVPANESFHGEELRQADAIVFIRRASIAILGTLPELAGIGPGKQRFRPFGFHA